MPSQQQRGLYEDVPVALHPIIKQPLRATEESCLELIPFRLRAGYMRTHQTNCLKNQYRRRVRRVAVAILHHKMFLLHNWKDGIDVRKIRLHKFVYKGRFRQS